VATKTVLSLFAVVTLVVTGCGGSEEAEVKQGALTAALVKADDESVETPATPAASATTAPKPVAPAESASVAVAPADSAAPAAIDEPDSMEGRESFSYAGGSRDPFVSLLSNTKVGPELPDLLLVAIYYDTRNPSASVVVMREKIGGKKYNLRPGDRLGRMRVTTIRAKDVTFAIDDFGAERQETVSLRKVEETP
jgi:hypothetical protein